jgi:hypothetical protein
MLNDPHVATLRYQLETDASLAFGSPAPREHDTSTFALRLAGGLLTCDMEAYFASAVAAKAVVEPVLRAWGPELHSGGGHVANGGVGFVAGDAARALAGDGVLLLIGSRMAGEPASAARRCPGWGGIAIRHRA